MPPRPTEHLHIDRFNLGGFAGLNHPYIMGWASVR
jgi:hypothetical protein